eukprot:TRINITY_DN552_c5_g1_i1.p1 TRINITY_DN552_c5_g1~~TRINITY_DN552_c5_g1_i1.p1  ORF type:complete len:410 (+),score=33.08 TRINITY_DN552_c5_g1_i1:4447-5676(+)
MGTGWLCNSPKDELKTPAEQINLAEPPKDILIQIVNAEPANEPDTLKAIVKQQKLSHSRSGQFFQGRDFVVPLMEGNVRHESANITEGSLENGALCEERPVGFQKLIEEKGKKPDILPVRKTIRGKSTQKSRQRSDVAYFTEAPAGTMKNNMWTLSVDKEKYKRQLKTEFRASPLELLSSRSPDHVFLSSDLLKYHPSFGKQFITRHCQITRLCFKYYKDMYNADLYSPIMTIPYGDIEEVKRIPMDTLVRGKAGAGKCHFEIFVKPIFWLRRQQQLKLGISQSEPKAPEQVKTKKKSLVDKVAFEDEDEAKDYISFVKAKGTSLAKSEKKLKTKLSKASFKSTPGKGTWRNREVEWYMAEERMVFGAKSVEECERWIWVLNWLLHSDNYQAIFYADNICTESNVIIIK